MSKHASPTLIGTFVIVALALAVAAIIVLGGGRFFHKTTRLVVYFEGSVSGLRVGAPVKFRGIEIGSVHAIRINMAGALRDPAHIRIPVIIEIDLDRLSAEGVVAVDLRDRAHVRALVALGLRAELETESLVTGMRYVALDIRPDSPAVLVNNPNVPYPEIPSVRGLLARLPDKAEQVLARLSNIDFEGLVRSVQTTVDDAHALLGSPHLKRTIAGLDTLTQRLNRTAGDLDETIRGLSPMIAEVRDTAKSAGHAVAPEGRLASQLGDAVTEMTAAARAMRRLAEHVDRDPGSLIRGGKQ